MITYDDIWWDMVISYQKFFWWALYFPVSWLILFGLWGKCLTTLDGRSRWTDPSRGFWGFSFFQRNDNEMWLMCCKHTYRLVSLNWVINMSYVQCSQPPLAQLKFHVGNLRFAGWIFVVMGLYSGDAGIVSQFKIHRFKNVNRCAIIFKDASTVYCAPFFGLNFPWFFYVVLEVQSV